MAWSTGRVGAGWICQPPPVTAQRIYERAVSGVRALS